MLERPILLHVPTGPGCNNRCVFCMEYGGGRRPTKTLAAFEEQLQRARSFTDEVVFTGGEPTLNKLLVQAVGAARERGFVRIGVISNGRRLADLELCQALLDAGLTELTVSIHGPEAAVHDPITGRDGSFDQTVAALGNLAALREDHALELKCNCTLVRGNLAHMAATWRLVEGFGVDLLNFNTVEPRGRASDDIEEVVPTYVEVLDAADASGLPFDAPHVSLSRVPPCAGGPEWVQEDFHFTCDEEVTHYDPAVGMARGPPCARCVLPASCEGVWERYVEVFGWEGLAPVRPPIDDELALDLSGPDGLPVGRHLRRGWLAGHRRLVLQRLFRSPELVGTLRLARSLGYTSIVARSDGRAIASLGVMRRVAALGLDGLRFAVPPDPRAVVAARRVGLRFEME